VVIDPEHDRACYLLLAVDRAFYVHLCEHRFSMGEEFNYGYINMWERWLS
jgi:hypothetical protein